MTDTDKQKKCSCGAKIDLTDSEIALCPECNKYISDSSGDTMHAKRTHFFKKPSSIASDSSLNNLDLSNAKYEELEPGTLLDHFRITKIIGNGGMGAVYRAMDLSLDRWVAVKVISNQKVLQDKDCIDAFIHEARAQAQVNHAGIATMYYIGVYNNMPYFAMEFVDGDDLEKDLGDKHIPVEKVIDIGLQVSKALSEANGKGVIHRDLKPGNIILTETGNAKLTDFGLAKTKKEGSLKITGSENMIGTPDYMAPEQAAGHETDLRTDIYSLGATLYHLAYGKAPFTGNNFMEVVSKHMSEKPDFVDSKVIKASPGFPEVLEVMMEKKPEDRYQSYEELEEALQNVRPQSRKAASPLKRIAAFLIDWTQFGILYLIAIWGVVFIYIAKQLIIRQKQAENPLSNPLVSLLTILFPLCVLGISQVLWGRSLGKFFMHLRLMSLNGTRPSKKRLALRFLIQYLPALCLLLFLLPLAEIIPLTFFIVVYVIYFADALYVLFNHNNRSLHDLLVGTWVVKQAEN